MQRLDEQIATLFEQRRKAALEAMDELGRQQAARAAAMSGYWLAELTVD